MKLPETFVELLHRLPSAALRRLIARRESLRLDRFASAAPHGLQPLRPAARANHPAPRNWPDPNQLPAGQDFTSAFNLRAIPRLPIPSAYVASLRNCLLVRTFHPWGESSFSICTPDGTLLKLHGLNSDPRDPKLREAVSHALQRGCPTLPEATWTLGYWYRNHYHWFIEWLPRILTARALGLVDGSQLMPADLPRPCRDSLDLLGFVPHWLDGTTPAWRIGTLKVVAETCHHPAALRSVAEGLTRTLPQPSGPRRKIWVSRVNAVHRRLEEAAAIEAWLSSRGWDCVRLESLNLAEQIQLLRSARALGGLHGAGLSNLLFCPAETPLLEVGLRERPTAEFYALAATLGSPYWYVGARRAGRHASVIHDDVILNRQELAEAVEDLERHLGAH